jgi:hypothetical protein
MGTCYVNVYVVFKAVVMAFSYAWRGCSKYIGRLLRILMVIFAFQKNYYPCEVLCSSWFLKELFELIKLILWRSNNRTYHLDFLRDS